MDALITGEGEADDGGYRVGLSIIDNDNVEHLIELEPDGEIKYYDQDEYPGDPSERTYREARHVEEACSYARYHVYRERGYDTLPEGENPDRLALTALAIAALPDDALLTHFGDLYQQFKSHYEGQERPLEWPEGFDDDSPAIYMKDIYLDLDLDLAELGAMADAMSDGTVFDILGDVPELTKRGRTRGFGDLPAIGSIARDHGLIDADGQPRPLEEWIEAVSDLHLKWRNERGNQFETGDEPNLDRDYDARLQVRPIDPNDLNEFRNSLIYNVKCQIRDCFIGYGVPPPEGVRLTGPGNDEWTVTYIQVDLYQDYHTPNSEVDWDVEGWPDRADEEDDDGGLL